MKRLMNRLRLIFTPVFLLVGCSMNEKANWETASANGFNLRLNQEEIVGRLNTTPRFLRIRHQQIDIVLDDRFNDIKDPDFMSVMATRFGLGEVKYFGSRELRCVDVPFYACGRKITIEGKQVVVLLRDQPTNESEVAAAEDAAIRFLMERRNLDA